METEGFKKNGHKKQREQSRQMIEEAFFSLMKEKEYEEITVVEITERADVARRTFYRLYGGKEDVLPCYLKKLCGEYKARYLALNQYDIRQIAEDYFSFWYQYRDFLLLLHDCGLKYMLYNEISQGAMGIVKSRIRDNTMQRDPNFEYFADYSAGGFIQLLFRWIENGMKETPKSYAETVSEAIFLYMNTNFRK